LVDRPGAGPAAVRAASCEQRPVGLRNLRSRTIFPSSVTKQTSPSAGVGGQVPGSGPCHAVPGAALPRHPPALTAPRLSTFKPDSRIGVAFR
jgi:hypothetical protein